MKAVIFDLDGTLVNSLEDLMDSVNYTMKVLGLDAITLEQTRQFVGNGADMLIKRALREENIELFPKAIDIFRGYYGENMMNKTRPYEGIEEVIDKLNEEGYVCGVVSNKPDFAVKIMVKKLLGDKIKSAVGADTEKRAKKPAPDGVYLVLNELGAAVENAVYAGDSEVDTATGKNAGIPVIGVSWGFRAEDALKDADVIINEPREILRAVEELLGR